jgi:signal transduction histidine kinase
VNPIDLSLPPPLDDAVRLMVREAVVNAVKHAQPSRVSIEVERDGTGSLRILVADDGHGFPFRGRVGESELEASNAGPVSLRERVVALGGSLAIESTAAGSRLEITVPVPRH